MTRHRGIARALALFAGVALLVGAVPAAAYERPQGDLDHIWHPWEASASVDGTARNLRDLLLRTSLPLVPEDTNERPDLFVFDRVTESVERVSVRTDGSQALPMEDAGYYMGPSSLRAISGDGRYVTFTHSVPLVPEDENTDPDVYVRDRLLGTTELLSVGPNGKAVASGAILSANGRWAVVNEPTGPPSAPYSVIDLVVYDRTAGVEVDRILDPDRSWFDLAGDISNDGQEVVIAENPGDIETYQTSIFRRPTRVRELVSVSTGGVPANAPVGFSRMTPDGRYVVLSGVASNLVPNDNHDVDVFLRDRVLRRTELVSVNSIGVDDMHIQRTDYLSDDARYVGFYSDANEGVVNASQVGVGPKRELLIRDRVLGLTRRVDLGALLSGLASPRVISESARHAVVGGITSEGVLQRFRYDLGPMPVGVQDLDLDVESGQILVSGVAALDGVQLASSPDPADDAADPTPTMGAREVGGEITGVSVAYRHEAGDLMVKLELAEMPAVGTECDDDCEAQMEQTCVPRPPPFSPVCGSTYSFALDQAYAGHPAVSYRIEFERGGLDWVVDVVRPGTPRADRPSALSPAECALRRADGSGAATLFDCGFGETGSDIWIPLGGGPLTNLRALTTVMGAPSGLPVGTLDATAEIDVPAPPSPNVVLGIEPAGTAEEDVAFVTPAELASGRFILTLSTSSLGSGAFDVWARVCLGEVCGTEHEGVVL